MQHVDDKKVILEFLGNRIIIIHWEYMYIPLSSSDSRAGNRLRF